MLSAVNRGTASIHLERYVGYLLRRAYVRAEQAASIAVPPPYAMRHLSVLTLLDERGPTSQQNISALTRVNRTIVVALIDTLEDDGLVRRERDETDRRSYALVLTDAGRRTLQRYAANIEQAEQLLMANLGAAQQARLIELLRPVVAADLAGQTQIGRRCGYLIAHAHHRLRAQGTAALAPLDLDPRHLAALATIEHHTPCSQEMVAKVLAVSAPVVVDLVDALVDAGFAARTRNRADRRRYDLTVTRLGHARLRAGMTVLDDIHDELRGALTADGVDELRDLLSALIDPPLAAR
jgi:DNA-binding MarR family transcriptional regulator